MNTMYVIIAAGAVVLGAIVFRVLLRRKPRKVRPRVFTARWRQLQKLCKDRDNWPFAILEADDLLDKVLKKKRYKGKTMGARLMAAQRDISDNDSIWAAHNLSKKIAESIEKETEIKLSKADVIANLKAFQAAMTDLGALKTATRKEGKND